VPAHIAALAQRDAVGVWRRGAEKIDSPSRNAMSLLEKGFQFCGAADEVRRRAEAAARPWPPPAAPVAETSVERPAKSATSKGKR
jgi:hypothetical protein